MKLVIWKQPKKVSLSLSLSLSAFALEINVAIYFLKGEKDQ